jgi:hypothetical protein
MGGRLNQEVTLPAAQLGVELAVSHMPPPPLPIMNASTPPSNETAAVVVTAGCGHWTFIVTGTDAVAGPPLLASMVKADTPLEFGLPERTPYEVLPDDDVVKVNGGLAGGKLPVTLNVGAEMPVALKV